MVGGVFEESSGTGGTGGGRTGGTVGSACGTDTVGFVETGSASCTGGSGANVTVGTTCYTGTGIDDVFGGTGSTGISSGTNVTVGYAGIAGGAVFEESDGAFGVITSGVGGTFGTVSWTSFANVSVQGPSFSTSGTDSGGSTNGTVIRTLITSRWLGVEFIGTGGAGFLVRSAR